MNKEGRDIRMNRTVYCILTKKRSGLLSVLPAIFLIISFLLTYGCNGRLKEFKQAGFAAKDLTRIAVLPLENFTPDKYADEKVRSLVIMDLLERNIDVVEPGEVTRAFSELRISSSGSLSTNDMRNLADILDVKVLLKGSVGTFEMKKGVSVEYPEVSIHLMLIDPESGQIIWSAWHSSGGASFWTRHFGAEGATLDDTAKKVIEEELDGLI